MFWWNNAGCIQSLFPQNQTILCEFWNGHSVYLDARCFAWRSKNGDLWPVSDLEWRSNVLGHETSQRYLSGEKNSKLYESYTLTLFGKFSTEEANITTVYTCKGLLYMSSLQHMRSEFNRSMIMDTHKKAHDTQRSHIGTAFPWPFSASNVLAVVVEMWCRGCFLMITIGMYSYTFK